MASKIKDLTPKYSVRTAADELKYEVTPGELPMADNWGGFQVFSQSFKRGFGSDVFGVDVNGLWLGAAEFADAPFRVNYKGEFVSTSGTFTGYVEDGTAAADVNANSTTISGGKITANSIDADRLKTSDIEVSIGIGTSGNMKLDGVNNRMTISDASNERARFGNL